MPQAIPAVGQDVTALMGSAPTTIPDPHQAKMGPNWLDESGHMNPDAVTLTDIREDPRAAFAKIGATLKRDLSNPRTWVMAAAMYFGPKAVGAVIPIAREATAMPEAPVAAAPAGPAAPSMFARMSAALKTAGPDVVGMVSPRLGKAIDVARSAAEGYRGATAPEVAPVEMPAAAPAPVKPSAAPSAPAPTRPAAAPVPAAIVSKLKLTTDEFRAVNELVKQGYPLKAVLEQLQQQRLPAAWRNLPTDADVAAAVKTRNDVGKWPEGQ